MHSSPAYYVNCFTYERASEYGELKPSDVISDEDSARRVGHSVVVQRLVSSVQKSALAVADTADNWNLLSGRTYCDHMYLVSGLEMKNVN